LLLRSSATATQPFLCGLCALAVYNFSGLLLMVLPQGYEGREAGQVGVGELIEPQGREGRKAGQVSDRLIGLTARWF